MGFVWGQVNNTASVLFLENRMWVLVRGDDVDGLSLMVRLKGDST